MNNKKKTNDDENKVDFANDQLGENSTEHFDDKKSKSNCGCGNKNNK